MLEHRLQRKVSPNTRQKMQAQQCMLYLELYPEKMVMVEIIRTCPSEAFGPGYDSSSGPATSCQLLICGKRLDSRGDKRCCKYTEEFLFTRFFTLYSVNRSLKRLVKKWLNLPQRTSAGVVLLLLIQSCAGLIPLVDGIIYATIKSIIPCKDRFVRMVIHKTGRKHLF